MSKFTVFVAWDDVPHLSEEAKAGLLGSYQAHERDARTKGIPSLGAGAIYPVAESDIVVAPFALPAHYKHVYSLDVGWNRTACVWGALDEETDIVYLYGEYYRAEAEPAVHAAAIRARGEWIPGVVDPAARGRAQRDGEQLLADYVNLGLRLTVANNAREAGIYRVWGRLSTGRLKVFSNLQNWLAEYRIYRRDDKGQIVKENDHLMDCTRYLEMSGVALASYRPVEDHKVMAALSKAPRHQTDYNPLAGAWASGMNGQGRR